MATFSVMRPILLIYGMDSGIQSVQESLESGNYAQAAFRAVALVDIVKSLNGEMWEPTSCFTGDTEVDTEAGNKEIKDIQVGDEVYSENPATGEKGLKKVTKLFVREVTELIHVTVGGEEIRTTATHPFWVVGKGWTEAGDLKIGDKLEMYSGEIIEVTDIYAEELATPVKVYNFEVEDWHTYFVSDNDVFVHNACAKTGDNLTRTQLKTIEKLRSGDDVSVNTVEDARALLEAMLDLTPPSEARLQQQLIDPKGTYRGDLINIKDPAGNLIHPLDKAPSNHCKFPHYNIYFKNGEKAAILITGGL